MAGKVAIITGGSSGIGVGIATEFAKEGYSVALVGRNETNLKSTAEKCMKLGLSSQKVLCITADMHNDDEVKSIVAKTITKFGRIDVLVNNAGMAKLGDIETCNWKDYDEIMQVNLRSAVMLTQEALPHLIISEGNIVNISSSVASHGFPGILAYAMSKAAMDHFTRCSAIELAPKSVRINSVQPGFISTGITEKMGLSKDLDAKVAEANRVKHPRGRTATVEEIGRTVVFLSSEGSSFTTGQIITIDGGFTGTLEP